MNKYYPVLILLLTSISYSQFKPHTPLLVDCLNSSFNLNYAITLCSYTGDYHKALAFINNSKKNIDENEKLFINALLTHNLYGKEKSDLEIAQLPIDDESKELIKLKILLHSSHPSFDEHYTKFIQKYPKNHQALKLKYKKLLLKEPLLSKNATINIISEIDSLMNSNSLKNEEKVYYSILKIDFLKQKEYYSLSALIDKKEITKRLLNIFNQNKELFNLEYFKYKLQYYDENSKLSAETLEYIKNNESSKTEVTSTNEAFELLSTQSSKKNKLPKKIFESQIVKIIQEEKDSLEIKNIKALLHFFTLIDIKKLPYYGTLNPLEYSSTITSLFNKETNITTINSIESFLNTPKVIGILEYDYDTDYSYYFQKNKENLKTAEAPNNELQQLYGLIVYGIYNKKKSIENLLQEFNVLYLKPNKKFKNAIDYLNFLDKNPLFLEEYSGFPIDSSFNLLHFIQEFNTLKEKYKGSVAILKFGLQQMIDAKKLANENNKEIYYVTFYKTLLDLMSISYDSSLDFKYFEPSTQYGRLFDTSYNDAIPFFYQVLSKENQIIIQNYAYQKLQLNPTNEDLIKFNNTINQ